ncbi:hypothetical protein [Pseudomonas syringae]|uniref:hypothetical protein n=1 Tax=Pseudomonas syringae TaxID=317 RepID=UPI000463E757|nr:hypothetical protein [Pseudomonas syringae]
MNTYNENLQETVNKTLADLLAQQNLLKSSQIANDYSLYYAQEAQISTDDALHDLNRVRDLNTQVNDLSELNENAVNTLLLSATMSNTDISTSTTNMATAAANVNIAAIAINALSSGIGSAFNSAYASMLGTDLYKHVQQANSLINEVANDAEEVSRWAMETSSKTSEVVTQAVLQQTADVKARIDGLLKITQAALDTSSAQVTAAKAAAATTVQQERQVEGEVQDINTQLDANRLAYDRTNRQLNLGLHIHVHHDSSLYVSFDGLPPSAPVFRAEKVIEGSIPAAAPVYFLTLLPQDQMATFSVEQAQQLFITKPEGTFQEVKATRGKPLKVALEVDVNNVRVKHGAPYVAYLYMEFSKQYRHFIGDFSDVLSSPSAPFTPAMHLPLATASTHETVAPLNDEGLLTTLHFTATGFKRELAGLEFRCILIEDDPKHRIGFMRSPDFPKAPIYFNVEIAQQVAPANYTTAERVAGSKPGKKKASDVISEDEVLEEIGESIAEGTVQHYTVEIDTTTTDNFGNLLRQGVSYRPYILTLVNSGNNEHSDAYISVLSDKLDSLKLESRTSSLR